MKRMQLIVLLGGPGSGKGTHGQVLADRLGYGHLSTGEQFREQIRLRTPLGVEAKGLIEAGRLVPDPLVLALVADMLKANQSTPGCVLDGFPRSRAQAEALGEVADDHGFSVSSALYLRISDDEVLRRLSGRLTCRECGRTFHETANPPIATGLCDGCGGQLFRRKDDEPATIQKRIAVFHDMIEPLLAFYRAAGQLVEIPAEGAVETVSSRVVATHAERLGPIASRRLGL